MGDLSRYFGWDEARCKCGCEMPDEVRALVMAHAHVLDGLRDSLGRPLAVTSWYRCPMHNRAVGGASDSRHQYGDATDLTARGLTGMQLAIRIEARIATGLLPEGGIGTYEAFPRMAHYDSRGKRARWRMRVLR